MSLPKQGDKRRRVADNRPRPGKKEEAHARFVIERDIPQAGSFTPQQLQAIAGTSCGVLQAMGPDIQWVQSYVTPDKIYCVYIAKSAELIREHARKGGFPADGVSQVMTVIDPTTSEPRPTA